MEAYDDELRKFESEGATLLQVADGQGFVENENARVWYTTFGFGPPLILLHGGLGHSGNWSYQIPALVSAGYCVVLIDSRGHGRSTRDGRPFSYELMSTDVQAVMKTLQIESAGIVGWSDGACTALILAAKVPSCVAGVFFFACNMDPSGVKPFETTPTLDRCFARHAKDYSELSATPDDFKDLVIDLTLMQRTQPNYSANDLGKISVPVLIVQSEHDEFIKAEHAEYLSQAIPNAKLRVLSGVSHFAPLQRPTQFNTAIVEFADKILGQEQDRNAAG